MLSYVNQLWFCSSGKKLANMITCSWRGDYPVELACDHIADHVEAVAERGEERLRIIWDSFKPHPTCPRCGGHVFLVKDLPINKAS